MSEEIKMSDVFDGEIVDINLFQDSCYLDTADSDYDIESSDIKPLVIKAINNHDRLTKIETDRKNAISKMSKSWRHDAESQPDLLSRFVDMANRQFDILQQQKSENAELREALGSLHQIATIFAGDSYSKTLLESEVKKLLMTHK